MYTAKIMKRVKKTNKLHIQKLGRPPTSALNKGSPVSLSSETESSDSESDYDSDSSASPPPEKSPLPAVKPTKAVDLVRYNTIKAVWFPRNKFVENNAILKGLAEFWEVVRTIRERWKNDREAVKKALEAKQESELPLLRERVENQLEMMEVVLKAAAEFGHPDLLSAYVYSPALSLVPRTYIVGFVRAYARDILDNIVKSISVIEDASAYDASTFGHKPTNQVHTYAAMIKTRDHKGWPHTSAKSNASITKNNLHRHNTSVSTNIHITVIKIGHVDLVLNLS